MIVKKDFLSFPRSIKGAEYLNIRFHFHIMPLSLFLNISLYSFSLYFYLILSILSLSLCYSISIWNQNDWNPNIWLLVYMISILQVPQCKDSSVESCDAHTFGNISYEHSTNENKVGCLK